MGSRYWLIHSNGTRQAIDPARFDLVRLWEEARERGGHLVRVGRLQSEPTAVNPAGHGALADRARVESGSSDRSPRPASSGRRVATVAYQPPISALSALFQTRLEQIYLCAEPFRLDVNARPTLRVLGGYYKERRLIRIYAFDTKQGRRPLEELFDTFLHEVAHHLEYTEPGSFGASSCGRVPGRMHSPLFWRILGELKGRWFERQVVETRRRR